jgi:HEAT repeat protein
MTRAFKHYTDVALLVLGLALFPAFVGCHGLGFASEKPSPRSSQKTASDEISAAEAKPASADDRAVFAKVQEKDPQGRERCLWVRRVDPEAAFRWHYPKMEEVLAQPVEQRPNLTKMLDDRDSKVAFNAAIALGRWGDAKAIKLLNRAVQTPTLPLPMRCAAVEALGIPTDPAVTAQLQKLIDQYGQHAHQSAAPYVSELHEELIHSLSRHEDPADDKRFVSALKSPRAEVRLEALKAWSAGKKETLPIEAADLRTDNDARVRVAALQAMASQKHPEAFEYLRQGLADTDFTVRRAAIGGLGILGGAESLAILKEQLKDRSDGVRAEAVKALAAMKSEQSVLETVDDKSWRVRLKAADSLSAFPTPAGAAAAEKLLEDPSAEVQAAVVQALRAWPLEKSGPLWLIAMSKSVFAARKAAARQLAEQWPPAEKFPVEGPADRRSEIVRDLGQQFRSRFNVAQTGRLTSITSQPHKPQPVTPQAMAQVESLLEADDLQGLIAYGPGLIDVLEALRFQQKRTLSEQVYRDVLPKFQPVFDALDQFSSPEVGQRRHAAKQLQAIAAKQSCGRLALDRLARLMAAESDDLVWLGVLQVVANENGEEAATLVSAGLGHSSSEVRRQACLYLAAHPDRHHALLLTAALKDPQITVVCAAVQALAAGGMDDPTPLRSLLSSTNDEIQLAAATALTHLHDSTGKPVLERLAYSNDPQVRTRVAVAMGENPDPAYLPILIHLLSDKAAVSRAALASLPQVLGEDISQPPDPPPAATTERIARWKRWFEHRKE